MKIKMVRTFKNFVNTLYSNLPSVKRERQVDILQAVVNRNKLIAPANESIDDVVGFARTQKIKHHIYY